MRSIYLAAAAMLCLASARAQDAKALVQAKAPAKAAGTITAAQAKDYIGKEATVCGVVASASYIAKGKGAPTLVNLDQPYPKQVFTVVVYGKDRAKFGKPEKDYLKRKLCATGTIETFKGKPQIVATDPSQIMLIAEKKPQGKAAAAKKK